MDFFNLFKTQPAQPVQQQQQAPATSNVSTVVTPTVAIPQPEVNVDPNNAAVPVVDSNNAIPEEEINKPPLDEFKDLWHTEPKKDGEKDTPVAPAPLKAEDLQKVMAKTDFSKVVTAEQLTAIAAGGEDAQQALAQALNAVAQNVMVQATLVNNKLTERAVTAAETAFTNSLPKLLRDQAVSNHSVNTNPLFNDPAIKPIIEATRSQLLEKFPDSTHEQITEMTERYITTMGAAFAPKKEEPSVAGEEDWGKFIEE